MAASEPTSPTPSSSESLDRSVMPQPGSQGLPTNPAGEAIDDIEADLKTAETALKNLRDRYQQLQTGPDTQQHLNTKLQTLLENAQQTKQQVQQTSSPEQRAQLRDQQKVIQQDIEQVQEDLYALELDLESRIFRWYSRDKQEWFWQFLRYAGLGFGAALLLQFLINR